MRSGTERERVRRLRAGGLNASQIAARTGIPRSTVRGWLRPEPALGRPRDDWAPSDAPADAYAYLLGAYLGDGYLAAAGRGVHRLVITNDARYPAVSLEMAGAVGQVMPANRVSIRLHPAHRCVQIGSYSKRWPQVFPQHGEGPKHLRRICLEPWQRDMTHAHPELFVRGLMHSDAAGS